MELNKINRIQLPSIEVRRTLEFIQYALQSMNFSIDSAYQSNSQFNINWLLLPKNHNR